MSRLEQTITMGGLLGVLVLILLLFVRGLKRDVEEPQLGLEEEMSVVRFLAVGDINLGRKAGQEILKGRILFPFEKVVDTLKTYDLVFGNLECQLTDQNGETQHPRNNLIFTGPPAGAQSLSRAGFHIVSTANNHALDYGVEGMRETISNLRKAAVWFVGTGLRDSLYRPVIVTRRGIRFAFFASTDIMNLPGRDWMDHVAWADTGALLPRIRFWRDSVDVIIISYHGGKEYSDEVSSSTLDFAYSTIKSGADVFLGHHPHVTYGIHETSGKLVVPSLGNFVFLQPQRYWTQRSYALSVLFEKRGTVTRMLSFDVKPVRSSLQPEFLGHGEERSIIQERTRYYSEQSLWEKRTW